MSKNVSAFTLEFIQQLVGGNSNPTSKLSALVQGVFSDTGSAQRGQTARRFNGAVVVHDEANDRLVLRVNTIGPDQLKSWDYFSYGGGVSPQSYVVRHPDSDSLSWPVVTEDYASRRSSLRAALDFIDENPDSLELNFWYGVNGHEVNIWHGSLCLEPEDSGYNKWYAVIYTAAFEARALDVKVCEDDGLELCINLSTADCEALDEILFSE